MPSITAENSRKYRDSLRKKGCTEKLVRITPEMKLILEEEKKSSKFYNACFENIVLSYSKMQMVKQIIASMPENETTLKLKEIIGE